MLAGPCGSSANAYLQYTATNAPAPQPDIGVSIDYIYVGVGWPNCPAFQVNYSNTHFAVGGSTSTWYDYTGVRGANYKFDDPGCWYGIAADLL